MTKLAVALLMALACGPRLQPINDKEIEKPELLVDTTELGGDFTARQSVEATFRDRKAIFQAIVQKTGERLVIVALTPQGQRAFVLEQRGRTVSFEKSPGAELPFSPWHILVDIHRGIFRGGGPSPKARPDGKHSVAHVLEPMTDTWSGGALTRRVISAHGTERAIIIDYATPSSGPLYRRPLTYRNHRVGYTLKITPIH